MLREPPYDDGAGRDDDDGDAAPSVTDILRAALEPVATQIDAAFIYGPLARGASSAHRDIDIMIIGRGIEYTDVIPHFIAAAKYLGRAINPSVYSADEWRRKMAAGNRVMLALMKQPKIFVIGTQDRIPQPF
jgi:predicted nucleotidyltransferase